MSRGALAGFGFSRSMRLLKRGEFLRISRSGKRVHSRHFLALFTPARTDTPRLGITVTKKVGNAVKRNRIKRLVREYYRLNRHRYAARCDINVIAKNQAAALSGPETFDDLHKLFVKLTR